MKRIIKYNFSFGKEILSDRNIFYFILLVTIPIYFYLSSKVGISSDEYLHYQQSEKVVDYYSSLGENKAAVEKTLTHLNYYGQFCDNLVTAVARIFEIKDVYKLRHLASIFSGWLILLLSGLFSVKLRRYRTGTIVIVMLFLSPMFLGHSLNNLKDIPFALGYVWFFYSMYKYLNDLPKPTLKNSILLGLSIAFTISIRIGGVILFCYLFFFASIWMYNALINKQISRSDIFNNFLRLMVVSVLSYFLGLLFWPYANENILINPIKSFLVMGRFPDIIKEIFEGKQYWSDSMPWYFIPKSMLITIPLGVLLGFLCFFIPEKKGEWKQDKLFYLFMVLGIVIPIAFVILQKSNVYTGWRQLIFIYPLFVILSATGIDKLLNRIRIRSMKWAFIAIVFLLFVSPIRHISANSSIIYPYFNEFVGGTNGAYGKYEIEYYGISLREASEKINPVLKEKYIRTGQKSIVASNFPHIINYFRDCEDYVQIKSVKYYKRGNTDWDYAVFGNRHIHPEQLQKNLWPPKNSIIKIDLAGNPACVVLERLTRKDYLGYKELRSENYNNAISFLKEAIAIDPDTESNYLNLAKAYFRNNQMSDALKVLNSCNNLYPGYDEAQDIVAEIYIQQKEYDKAISLLKKNISGNPKYVPSYYKLINTCITIGDNKAAHKYIKEGLKENTIYWKEFVNLKKKIR